MYDLSIASSLPTFYWSTAIIGNKDIWGTLPNCTDSYLSSHINSCTKHRLRYWSGCYKAERRFIWNMLCRWHSLRMYTHVCMRACVLVGILLLRKEERKEYKLKQTDRKSAGPKKYNITKLPIFATSKWVLRVFFHKVLVWISMPLFGFKIELVTSLPMLDWFKTS